MPRTTDQPRLGKLEPAALADSILRVLADHAHEVSCFLGRENLEDAPSALRDHLQMLVQFAQGKLRRSRTACCEYLTIRLTHNLFASAWESQRGRIVHPGTKIDELGWDDPIGVLLKACFARLALDYDEPLRIVDLAVLAEVTPDHVRLLMRQGTLPPQPRGVGSLTPFTAPVARALLRSRGVPGIRDELKPDDRVALLGIDRTFCVRLFNSERGEPKEHAGEEGFVIEVPQEATEECSIRLDSGVVLRVRPRWLSRIEPLAPALARIYG